MKPKEKQEARRLRKNEGCSIGEIAKKLGVSKGSVSLWVRNIELTEEQKRILFNRDPVKGNREVQRKGLEKANKAKRLKYLNIRKGYQQEGRKLAKADDLFRMGCMLYWAEGAKNKNTIQFTNSDPEMMKFFKTVLVGCLNLPKNKFRIHVHCPHDDVQKAREYEDFWISLLNLSESNLGKTVMNNVSAYSKCKKSKNKLLHGTCHLVVGSTKGVQMIWGGIQEIIGFTREEWLW